MTDSSEDEVLVKSLRRCAIRIRISLQVKLVGHSDLFHLDVVVVAGMLRLI